MIGNAETLRRVVEEVLKSYDLSALISPTDRDSGNTQVRETQAAPAPGVFSEIDAAVQASIYAQRQLVRLTLSTRKHLVEAMRNAVLENNESLCGQAVSETGLGNVRDKLIKNRLAVMKTPGPEDVESVAYTDEHGLTLVERAPYGVIGAITPCTNPIATIASNSIGMISAGNSVVFNVHPAAVRISIRLVSLLNDAVVRAGGPSNLLTTVVKPTVESAGILMKHPGVALLVVTGGPAVVRAAMGSGKKAVCAGPGNPPCVVDGTADIVKAGRDIVNGAGFDHNIVCICEKEILVVESVADRLKQEMKRCGAFEFSADQTKKVTELVIAKAGGPGIEGAPNKDFVGKSPQFIAKAAGIEVPSDTRLLICETDRSHPLVWTEQLMPVIPVVRMKDVDEAIEFAVKVENGCRHTAVMHSHDVEKLSKMARLMNCSLFVKNGPCYAGLGEGGAGFTSFTIASPTGEGITRARTFTRERRCTLVDSFRII